MKKNFPVFLFLVALCPLACVDEIELPAPDKPAAGMMVQGKFLFGKKSKVAASVFELYTNPNQLPKPIGGADVVLQDDEGHEVELISNFDGNFYLEIGENDPNFPVQTGRKYRLQASLPGGRVYQSAWETLLPVPEVDSVRVDFFDRETKNLDGSVDTVHYARFDVSTGLNVVGNQSPARFRWEFDQSYRITDDYMKTCYTVRVLLNDNVTLLDGNTVGEQYLDGYALFETRVDYRFAEGFYLILYQQSISENAFGYFYELNQLLAKKGTLFDPPAGEIRSNMTSLADPDELVYGFFYAASQDTARLYVSPEIAGNPKKYCPLPPLNGAGPRPPNACDDCLLESGDSRTEKPDWWQE